MITNPLFALIIENMRPNKHDRTSAMSLQLCLNCWVIGDEAGRVFPVNIAGTESVGTLKKAIKEKNQLHSITSARSSRPLEGERELF